VIDLEVSAEIVNGTKVEKERKMRLLCWRVFSLSQNLADSTSLLSFVSTSFLFYL